MAFKIIMPQGGQDITEGTVVKWLKAEGEKVAKGEVVCEVETEKAVFEVESPAEGVLLKVLVGQGEKAPIFAAIGIVGQAGEAVGLEGLAAEQAAEEKPADRPRTPERTTGPETARPRDIKASGRARKLAAARGTDLSRVRGTGPNGRITARDVLATDGQTPPEPSSTAAPPGPAGLRGKTLPMSRVRQVIARRLQQSKQSIPHFYVTVSVDVTEALRVREELNQKAGEDDRITMNDLIVKASALALEAFDRINCTLRDQDIVYLKEINIGIAVALEDGLVVPVIPAVDGLSLKGIAKKSREIIRLARAGRQADLTPGTFTVSNMGMLDVENFIAIINPPETAILAVGSTEKRGVVAPDRGLHVRDVMKMTLSADHRITDGVTASRFINRIKHHLQNPQDLLF